MDLKELESLLSLLNKHKVKLYSTPELDLEFSHLAQAVPASTEKDQYIPVPEDHLPPDLKADDLFNYDKVLNWSGTPDSESGMPLTGES